MSDRPTDTFDKIAGKIKQGLVDQVSDESAEDPTIVSHLGAIADELAKLNQVISTFLAEPVVPTLVECERCAGEGTIGGTIPCEPCKGTGKVEAP